MTKHHITIDSTLETVFAAYADVARWPEWDNEVREVHLPAGLKLGATGHLIPRQGPKAMITVTECTQLRSFTMQAALPLCKMHFGHMLREDQGKTTATHWVEFTGPLAFLFRQLIGKGITATLPTTLQWLKRHCEAKASHP
jgi:hypothetical protein